MAQLIAALAALFGLINEIWSAYQNAKQRAQGRDEVRQEQAKANAKAKAHAQQVKKDTAAMSDRDLARELSSYYRD